MAFEELSSVVFFVVMWPQFFGQHKLPPNFGGGSLIIKWDPPWRNQTMQMYGKNKGFSPVIVHCLGWYYNNPLSSCGCYFFGCHISKSALNLDPYICAFIWMCLDEWTWGNLSLRHLGMAWGGTAQAGDGWSVLVVGGEATLISSSHFSFLWDGWNLHKYPK